MRLGSLPVWLFPMSLGGPLLHSDISSGSVSAGQSPSRVSASWPPAVWRSPATC